MVSSLSIIFIVIALIFGFILPAVPAIYCKKKYKCNFRAFFFGCLIFFTFVVVLENFVHSFVLKSSIGETIRNNIIVYAFYGGLIAGLFEETGRLFAFKSFFKKEMSDDYTGIMYGVGHGGFEAFYLLVPGMISNLVMSYMINNNKTDLLFVGQNEDGIATIQTTIDALISISPPTFLLSIVERMSAMTAHVAFSVLVWFAVKNSKYVYYWLSIFLHALLDILTVLLNNKVNDVILELFVIVMVAIIVIISLRVYKKEHVEIQPKTPKPYMYQPKTEVSDNENDE